MATSCPHSQLGELFFMATAEHAWHLRGRLTSDRRARALAAIEGLTVRYEYLCFLGKTSS